MQFCFQYGLKKGLLARIEKCLRHCDSGNNFFPLDCPADYPVLLFAFFLVRTTKFLCRSLVQLV